MVLAFLVQFFFPLHFPLAFFHSPLLDSWSMSSFPPPPPNNGLNVSLPASSSSSSLISPKTSLESPTYSLSSIWSASKTDSMTSATRSAFSASTPAGGLPSRKFNVPPPPSQNNLGLNKSTFGNVVLMNSDSALNRGTKTTDTLKGSVPM